MTDQCWDWFTCFELRDTKASSETCCCFSSIPCSALHNLGFCSPITNLGGFNSQKNPRRKPKPFFKALLTHLLLIGSNQSIPASPRAPSYHSQDQMHMKTTSKKKKKSILSMETPCSKAVFVPNPYEMSVFSLGCQRAGFDAMGGVISSRKGRGCSARGGEERLFYPSPPQIVSPESTQGPELPKCRCFCHLGVVTGGCCLPGCPPCSGTSRVPWQGCQPLVCAGLALKGFQPNCLGAGLGQ